MVTSISETRMRLLPPSPIDARAELRHLCTTMLRDPAAARNVAPLLARVVLEYLDGQSAAGL